MKSLREITGRTVHPAKITFVHIRSSGFREFERFCGCPVEFGGSSDQLVFSNQSLATPLITEDVHLLDTLRPICDEAAKQRETAPGTLRALVENEAQKLLPHGRAQRHNVAKKLAMSTRTLARRLASEGTTFEEVIDELRRSLALQYIKTPEHLAFSDCLVARLRRRHIVQSCVQALDRRSALGGARREIASSACVVCCIGEGAWRQHLRLAPKKQNLGPSRSFEPFLETVLTVARSWESPRGQAEAASSARSRRNTLKMAAVYEDNFGFWDIDGQEEQAFFEDVRRQSVQKTCDRCERPVRLIPSKTLCASCVTALECGAPASMSEY